MRWRRSPQPVARHSGRQDLEEALNRRVESAMQKISLHEIAALQELRTATVDLSLQAVRRVLMDELGKDSADEAVRSSLDEVKRKFH